jgi:hypothetical protein
LIPLTLVESAFGLIPLALVESAFGLVPLTIVESAFGLVPRAIVESAFGLLPLAIVESAFGLLPLAIIESAFGLLPLTLVKSAFARGPRRRGGESFFVGRATRLVKTDVRPRRACSFPALVARLFSQFSPHFRARIFEPFDLFGREHRTDFLEGFGGECYPVSLKCGKPDGYFSHGFGVEFVCQHGRLQLALSG